MPKICEHLYGFNTENGWSGFVWNFMIKDGKKVHISEDQMKIYLTDHYGADVEVSKDIQAGDWTSSDPSEWENLIVRPGYDRPHYEDEPEPEMKNLQWWDGRLSLEEDNLDEEGAHSGRQPRVAAA